MSAGTLALILNFAFVLILVIGFLIGLWRGVKKAALNLGITVIGVVVGFFVSAPITRAVLEINVAGGQTINEWIVSFITEDADIKMLYDTTPSLQQTVAGLPFAIVNVVMFLLVSIAVMLVTYLIYRIIACFIKKKDKEGNKIKQYRLAGGAVGLAKALILTLFISMPFVSLIGTANDLINPPPSTFAAAEDDEKKQEGPLTSLVPKQVADIVDGLDTSAFGVLGNMFGLDNAMFDYLSEFKVDGEKVYIRQEVDTVVEVYEMYNAFSETLNSQDKKFKDVDFEKIEAGAQTLSQNKFVRTILSDAVFNLLKDNDKYSLFKDIKNSPFADVLTAIGKSLENETGSAYDYFSTDVTKLYNAIKGLAVSEALDDALAEPEITIDGLVTLATNHEADFKTALHDIFEMKMFKASAPAVVNVMLDMFMDELEEVKFEAENVDWEAEAGNLIDILTLYGDLDVDVNTLLSSTEEIESLLAHDSTVDITKLFSTLGQMVDKFNKTQIFQTNGQSVIEKLIVDNGFGIPADLENEDAYKPTNQDRYKNFFIYLSEPLERVKELDLYSKINAGADPNALLKTLADALSEDYKKQQDAQEAKFENTLELIILRLYDIQKINDMIIPKLKEMDNSLVSFKALNTRTDWEEDIKQISTLLVKLNEDSGNGQTFLDLALDDAETLLNRLSNKQEGDITITDVLTPVLSAKSMTNLKTSIFDTFNSVLSTILDDDVTVDATKANKDNAERICSVFESFVELNAVYQSGKTTLQEIWNDSTGKIKIQALVSAMADGASNPDDIFYGLYISLTTKIAQLMMP